MVLTHAPVCDTNAPSAIMLRLTKSLFRFWRVQEEGLLCALESVKCERSLLQPSPPCPTDPAPSDEADLRRQVEGAQERLCTMYEDEDRDYVTQLQHLRRQCGLAQAGHTPDADMGRAAESR